MQPMIIKQSIYNHRQVFFFLNTVLKQLDNSFQYSDYAIYFFFGIEFTKRKTH